MIALERLSRTWPEFQLQDVSLAVEQGSWLSILGPTGAGKTLLLELIVGAHSPDSGRVLLRGIDVTRLPPERRKVAMVYQDALLFPHLTAGGNMEFGLRVRKVPQDERRARVRAMGELLRVSHLLHRRPATLSGGERQRIALGRALVTEPDILLMDEAFSALDRGTSEFIQKRVTELQKEKGMTVVHVTHDIDEARDLADVLAVLVGGRLQGVGTPVQLLRRPPTLAAAQLLGSPNILRLVELAEGEADPWATARVTDLQLQQHLRGRCLDAGLRGGSFSHALVVAEEVHLAPLSRAEGVAVDPDVVVGKVRGIGDRGGYLRVKVAIPGISGKLRVHVGVQSLQEGWLQVGASVGVDLRDAIHPLATAESTVGSVIPPPPLVT